MDDSTGGGDEGSGTGHPYNVEEIPYEQLMDSKPEEPEGVTTAETNNLPYVAGRTYDLTTPSPTSIGYYHCFNNNNNNNGHNHQHVFLLHGSAFDREIWMSDQTGIFEKFCAEPGVSVSSLDLPVSTGFDGLKRVVDDVAEQVGGGRGDGSSKTAMLKKPVVLVTPSASGWSVVSAMLDQNDWSAIPDYIEAWVPVAPVSLSRASDEQIAGSIFGTTGNDSVPVLAVYGNEDTGGGRISQRLGRVGEEVAAAAEDSTNVQVKVVEIEGGHPAYRRSPDIFVREILDFLSSL